MFSGGRDSLAALAYVKENVADVNALYVDTTIGLPHTREYFEETCRSLEVPLVVLEPQETFETLVKKWALPSIRYRWCCLSPDSVVLAS